MSKNVAPATSCREMLIAQYEELRAKALNNTVSCSSVPGFGIIVFRGVAAWMKAITSVVVALPQSATITQLARRHESVTTPIDPEVATILTNIVIAHHEQVRFTNAGSQ